MSKLLMLIAIATIMMGCGTESLSGLPSRCRPSCGNHTIQFPLGIDAGCGSSQFTFYCRNGSVLTMEINKKVFMVQHVDYGTKTLVLEDPSMSDCSKLSTDDYGTGFASSLASSGLVISPSTTLLFLNCLNFPQEMNFLNNQYDCHDPTCLTFMGQCHNPFESCCRVYDPADNLNLLFSLGCTSYTSLISPPDLLLFLNASSWFYGMQLQWSVSADLDDVCRRCHSQLGICGYDQNQQFTCMCDSCNGDCSSGSCTGLRARRMAAGLSVAGGFLLLLSSLACFFRIRLKLFKKVQSDTMDHLEAGRNTNMELAHVLATMAGPLPLTLFTRKELVHATGSFSDSQLIGDGGCGMVYKAKFCDGRVAAVKRLNHTHHRRLEQFYNEVRILSQLKHPHLVQLLGFCFEATDLLLVFEYVSNGTLEEHIHGDNGGRLQWEMRLSVAHQVARALAYLHFDINPPIFHRDVKSSNILLDEQYQAKLADFGLSRLVPIAATHVSTGPQGTPGYVDPEYHQSYRLTDKSDVYSFGIVLLELVSRKRAVDLTRGGNEVNLSAFAISRMQNGALEELLDLELVRQSTRLPAMRAAINQVAELAFKCVALERQERPNMKDVVDELQRLRTISDDKSTVAAQIIPTKRS